MRHISSLLHRHCTPVSHSISDCSTLLLSHRAEFTTPPPTTLRQFTTRPAYPMPQLAPDMQFDQLFAYQLTLFSGHWKRLHARLVAGTGKFKAVQVSSDTAEPSDRTHTAGGRVATPRLAVLPFMQGDEQDDQRRDTCHVAFAHACMLHGCPVSGAVS